MTVTADKSANIANACKMITDAVTTHGADLVILPECFNCPYSNACFPSYAEDVSSTTSETISMLSSLAQSLGIHLIGGSIPEREGERIYNTSLVFGPTGEMLAKHRKVHLFDIDIPNKIRFMESDTLTPGEALTTFDIGDFRVGLGICYDMRFPEFARATALRGCHLLVYPGAFNMTTGPLHWELLQRARAVDNLVYVATVAPARVQDDGYVSFANSTMVDPMGRVLVNAGVSQNIVCEDVSLKVIKDARAGIPVLDQKREDVYASKA